jgi:DNA-binding MarR family transcriptional regulator
LANLVEEASMENLERTREDLLQILVEQMFSIMKQIHRDISHPDPLLSPPQARLLFAIANKKDEGISVNELARMTGVTPGAITQVVNALVSRNLVRRVEDPNDRRIVRLILNIDVKNKIQRFHKEFYAALSRYFDVLSVDEIKQLVHLLSKINSRQDQFH